MSLVTAFESGKNLGDLISAWHRHVKSAGVFRSDDPDLKRQVRDAASFVAPAALVATLVKEAALSGRSEPVRVLFLGSDPIIRFDHSAWASMAGDLMDAPRSVQILSNFEEEAITPSYPIAQALALPHRQFVSYADVRDAGPLMVDLVIWIHPTLESSVEEEIESRITALQLMAAGVPTYATSFNEVDLHGQNYLLNEYGAHLQPLGGEIARGARSINRFGIATKGLGVDGGWCAVLSKLVPATETYPREDVETIKTCLGMFHLEGALQSAWSLGQRINGVAFNRILPVGLLGNMAVDPLTGLLFAENDAKELEQVGHLWKSALQAMPVHKRDLLLWGAVVKLSFQRALPKEPEKRLAAIELLERGLANGVVSAGVALARAYEASGTEENRAKALSLYRSLGGKHPYSAFSLAYDALSGENLQEAEAHFRTAVEYGYPVAHSDLGKLLYDAGRHQEGIEHLMVAAEAGDAEANYELGELHTKAGKFHEGVEHLRKAWLYGHADAASLALEVSQYMLAQGIGKRTLVKREIREVSACLKKLQRRSEAT